MTTRKKRITAWEIVPAPEPQREADDTAPLKACPFCPSPEHAPNESTWQGDYGFWTAQIHCIICRVTTEHSAHTEAEAVESAHRHWNTRAAPATATNAKITHHYTIYATDTDGTAYFQELMEDGSIQYSHPETIFWLAISWILTGKAAPAREVTEEMAERALHWMPLPAGPGET